MEGTPIDIMFLLERLEAHIEGGRALPLTGSVVIDKEAALAYIDEMRAVFPREIAEANRTNAERDRILERATEESERVLARAQEQAAFLIEERGLTKAAEEEGARIIQQAEGEAAETQRGADEYAVNVLVGLEGELVRTLQSVRKGVEMLDARGAAPEADDEVDEDGDEVEGFEEAEPDRAAAARW